MLERLGDRVKGRLKEWTLKMAGDDAEERLASVARPENEYGVDPFGFSLEYALSALAPFVWLYKHYHRVQTHGIENVRVAVHRVYDLHIPAAGQRLQRLADPPEARPKAFPAMGRHQDELLRRVETGPLRAGQRARLELAANMQRRIDHCISSDADRVVRHPFRPQIVGGPFRRREVQIREPGGQQPVHLLGKRA